MKGATLRESEIATWLRPTHPDGEAKGYRHQADTSTQQASWGQMTSVARAEDDRNHVCSEMRIVSGSRREVPQAAVTLSQGPGRFAARSVAPAQGDPVVAGNVADYVDLFRGEHRGAALVLDVLEP